MAESTPISQLQAYYLEYLPVIDPGHDEEYYQVRTRMLLAKLRYNVSYLTEIETYIEEVNTYILEQANQPAAE